LAFGSLQIRVRYLQKGPVDYRSNRRGLTGRNTASSFSKGDFLSELGQKAKKEEWVSWVVKEIFGGD